MILLARTMSRRSCHILLQGVLCFLKLLTLDELYLTLLISGSARIYGSQEFTITSWGEDMKTTSMDGAAHSSPA